MALKTFLEAKKAYEKALVDVAEGLQAALQALIPEGYAMYWTQGTPSFNDGDPCTFSQGDCTYLKLPEGLSELGELGSGYEPDNGSGTDEDYPDMPAELGEVWQRLSDDLAEAVFGDNVRVILTRTDSDIKGYYRD